MINKVEKSIKQHTKVPGRMNPGWLRKIGMKEVLIPGLLMAGVLGWRGWNKLGPDIYKDKKLFPDTGVVRMVMDGDTLQVQNGLRIRLIGINAADRGEEKYDQAKVSLRQLVEDKRVWLEYDRYQDDKSGRVLAWIWVGCETTPKFTKPDYMRLSFNRSKEGLTTNPEGCQLGKLVQEELIKQGMAKVETYKDRGELKYQQRISEID